MMDIRHTISAATSEDGFWIVDRATFDQILERLNIFCETRTDEVVSFANLAGIVVMIRVSQLGELTISTEETRQKNYELNKSLHGDRPTWDE